MAVALDATNVGTNGTGNLSWTHTPVTTPRGILVTIVQNVGSTDEVTGVTYGGVTMNEVSGSPLLHVNPTHGDEAGAVYAYFLGSSIPTGAQTVLVSVNGTGSAKSAASYSIGAAADTEVHGTATINTAAANPSTTLALGGNSCFVALGGHSGQAATNSTTQLTNWLSTTEFDFGSQVAVHYRYSVIGTADVTCGWTQTSEDATMIAVAIKESSGGASASDLDPMGMMGFFGI